MTDCPYPGCEWTGQHRPYANKRDGIPSGSTIAGMAEEKSDGMAWAAAGITASYAVHHHTVWPDDRTGCKEIPGEFCKACLHIRAEFNRRWKAKAALGTHVHHLVADLAAGGEVESDDAVGPYLDAWDLFVVTHNPTWVHLERTVSCGGLLPYRGTFDAIADLTVRGERTPWLVDWKSGRLHVVSQTLQLAGYRYSDDITTWDDDGEHAERKMPPVKHCGVVLLKGDGTFELVELPADQYALSAFMHLRAVYEYRRKLKELTKSV